MRTRPSVGVFLASCFLAALVTCCTSAQDSTKPVGEEVPLHRLSNDELISRADSLLTTASGEYLAESRGFTRVELIVERAAADARAVVIPAETPGNIPPANRLDAARLAAEHYAGRYEALQNRHELRTNTHEAIGLQLQQLEAVQTAGANLLATLDVLNEYLLEIQLRIRDGTLSDADLPESLRDFDLTDRQDKLSESLNQIKSQTDRVRATLQSSSDILALSQAELATAEADSVDASQSHTEELKRQAMEEDLLSQPPQRVINTYEDLQEEYAALQGAYRLSWASLTRAKETAARLKRASSDATPAAQDGGESVETEEAAVALQTSNSAYVDRTNEYRSELLRLDDELQSFQADTAMLKAHLFEMHTVASIVLQLIADGSLPSDAMERTVTVRLQEALDQLVVEASDTAASTRIITDEVTRLDAQLAHAKSVGDKLAKQLEELRESREMAQQLLQWEDGAKQMELTGLIERFTTLNRSLDVKRGELKEDEGRLQELESKVSTERDALEGLEDSFFQQAKADEADEELAVLRGLYEFAGIETKELLSLESRYPSQPSPEGTAPTELAQDPKSDTADKATESEARETATDAGIAEFQTRLSGRVALTEEQDDQRQKCLTAYQELETGLRSRADAIELIRGMAMESQVLAVELKKRVGKGLLSGDQVPEGMTQAPNLELATDLSAEKAKLLQRLTAIEADKTALESQEPGDTEVQAALVGIQSVVGTRINVLSDVRKLASESKPQMDLSDGELKTLQQRAKRRLYAEIPSSNWFDTSDEAKDLAELLHTYFVELLQLENQREVLALQEEKTLELVQLAQDERTQIVSLQPLLDDEIRRFENQRVETLAKTQALLAPEKSLLIAEDYQAQTGRVLEIPPEVPSEQRQDSAGQAARLLFDLHVRTIAAQHWKEFFVLRQSQLNDEVADYQVQLGEVEARTATVNRRVRQLTGHPQDEGPDLSNENAESADDQLLFAEGEIGVAKQELGRIRSNNARTIGYELGAILLGAFVLILISSLLFGWLERRTDSAQAQTKYLLSAARSLSRAIVIVVALIMILSSLGFNIGAILAGLGIGGLAIGLAAQKTLADILGGIMLMVQRPFKIGDVVNINDNGARKVTGMSWRATRLESPFGQVTYLPNNQVADAKIVNCTSRHPAGDWMDVFVDPGHDIHEVLQILDEVLQSCDRILEPKGVWVGGVQFFENRQMIHFWPWWDTDEYFKRNGVLNELWQKILVRFKEAGITAQVSFPNVEAHRDDSEQAVGPHKNSQ